MRDENQRTREVLNNEGLVISSNASVLSRQQTNGGFSTSTPNASMAVTYPSFNAIRNAGGEYGEEILPTPWQSNTPDGVQRSQITEAYSGHNALVFDPASNGDQMIQHLAHPSYLWQGKTYFIRFWIKRKGNPGGAPIITVSLQKEDGSGNTLSAKTSHSITLRNGNWTLFEATINTHGGQYYSWNDHSYTSKIVLSSNRSDVDYLIDEMYLGELVYGDESAPSYAISFSNGLGQSIQTQTWNGTDYTVKHSEYDDLGRPWKSWRAYNRATRGKFDMDAPTHATNSYPSGHRVFSERTYYADPLSRLKYVYPDGANLSEKIEYKYGAASIGGLATLFPYTEVIGIDGVRSRAYTDYVGQTIRNVQAYGTSDVITTETLVDPIERISESRPPNYFTLPLDPDRSDWVSRSTSDFMGMNLSATSPDAGTAKIKNDEQGRLRFSQSAQQAVNSTLSFTSYDALSRPTVSGEAAADFDALQAGIDHSFESDPLNAISVTAYDTKPSSAEFLGFICL